MTAKDKDKNGKKDDLFEKLLEEAQERGEKLTLRQSFRLLGRLTWKTFAIFLGLLASAFALGFAAKAPYDRYFGTETTPSSGLRIAPQGRPLVKPIPDKDQPPWLGDDSAWLEQEGDRLKNAGQISGYALAEAQYVTTSATPKFVLALSVPETYTVRSRTAFRITSVGGRALFERLEPKPSNESFRELQVSVGECEKGDTVLVLVRMDCKNPTAAMDVAHLVTGKLQ